MCWYTVKGQLIKSDWWDATDYCNEKNLRLPDFYDIVDAVTSDNLGKCDEIKNIDGCFWSSTSMADDETSAACLWLKGSTSFKKKSDMGYVMCISDPE